MSRRASKVPAAERKKLRRWDPGADLLALKAAHEADPGAVKPGEPLPCRSKGGVFAVGGGRTGFDLFAPGLRTAVRHWAFAAMASSGSVTFLAPTRHPGEASDYLESVERDAAIAAARYERSLRAQFVKHKWSFKEGYSLPEPPTPELRWIYDAAAAFEGETFPPPRPPSRSDRPRRQARGGWAPPIDVGEPADPGPAPDPAEFLRPSGRGFSGGEYHWRPWPLGNVAVCVEGRGWCAASPGLPALSRDIQVKIGEYL